MSTWQVKEVLKSAKYTWRSVRKSMKKQRDEGHFEFFKQELVELCVLDKKGLIRLWFYDESGFNLNPNALYAWLPPQKEAQNISLPAKRGNVLTVAGFLRHDNTLEAYSQKEAMNAQSFIAFTENFIQNQVLGSDVQNIVIIDNASFHKVFTKLRLLKSKCNSGKSKTYFFSLFQLIVQN